MITVEAAGAVTPVGTSLPDTAAALYTRVQLLEDLGVLDADGEPLSGMKLPFPAELDAAERVSAMAHALVDECTGHLAEASAPVPLILCCAEPDAASPDAASAPARLLAEVIAKAPIAVDPSRSRIVARGRAGALEALGAALALLKDGSCERCLVGGVDSLVTDDRLERLVDAERLLSQSNQDGFMAGEAGAMLLLRTDGRDGGLARWLAAAAGDEKAIRGSDGPVTGTGMQEAMAKALELARVGFGEVACIAHDFSGEQRYFEELLLASSRLAQGKPAAATVEVPALSVGETGAAAAFVSLALLAFLQSRGAVAGPGLALTSCDGPERGAIVLAPFSAGRR